LASAVTNWAPRVTVLVVTAACNDFCVQSYIWRL
jgi:hypothetical protein